MIISSATASRRAVDQRQQRDENQPRAEPGEAQHDSADKNDPEGKSEPDVERAVEKCRVEIDDPILRTRG